MRIMTGLIFLALTAWFSGCSDEPDLDTIRYEWPSWSGSNDYVLSRYHLNPDQQTAESPITFVLHRVADGTEMQFHVPKIDPALPVRYWVSHTDDVLVVGGGGLRVADFQGNVLNDRIMSVTGIAPTLMAFSRSGLSYYWAQSEGGRIRVGQVLEYAERTLAPEFETILLDSLLNQRIEDIVETREGACAVLLSDGTILGVSKAEGATVLHTSVAMSSQMLSTERLYYLPSPVENPLPTSPDFLYYLDGEGLGRINLVTLEQNTLLPSEAGNLLSFDVEESLRTILFVTSGNQVWLASENAAPVQVLFYEHSMARFSPDGTSVAAVGYVNGLQNRLSILKYRQ